MFFMNLNDKYQWPIKYSIGVLFYALFWISCINCYWSRSSWISRLKTISNLYVFLFSSLQNFFMGWNCKYRVSLKYSIGVLFYRFLWISCINCYWSRCSWFSRLKTISSLNIFFYSPLHIVFMNWNGKYRVCLKYSIAAQFYRFFWISCINCYWSRGSWFSRIKTTSNLFIFFLSPLHMFFMSKNDKY